MVKVPCSCMVCQYRFDRPCGYIILKTPTENNAIEVVCPHSGGVTFIVNQGYRYELWTEESFVNHYEGNFAVAVSSISTALERFNEVFIKWSMLVSGLKKPDIDRTWKDVSKYSERQIGALAFARAIAHAKFSMALPDLPGPRVAELRNLVVHGGLFPTAEQSEKHITRILEYIFASIRVMTESQASLEVLSTWEIALGHSNAAAEIKRQKLSVENCAIATLSFPYRLAMHNASQPFTFAKLIDDAAKANRLKRE